MQVEDGVLVLYFVRSPAVDYLQRQIDPLFETDSNRTLRPIFAWDDPVTFFAKQSPVAYTLGCVETSKVCVNASSTKTLCFDASKVWDPNMPFEYPWERASADSSFRALLAEFPAFGTAANLRSDSYWTQYRAETRWLEASGKMAAGYTLELGGYPSLGLAENQWEIEAQKIFNISLARLQLNSWSIARGERIGDDIPEYDDLSVYRCAKAECRKAFCGSVKIQGLGWKNISLFWFIALLLFSMSLAVGSVEIGKHLILVWSAKAIWYPVRLVFTRLVLPTYRKVKNVRWRLLLATSMTGIRLAMRWLLRTIAFEALREI
jgi:hypothetical protein